MSRFHGSTLTIPAGPFLFYWVLSVAAARLSVGEPAIVRLLRGPSVVGQLDYFGFKVLEEYVV